MMPELFKRCRRKPEQSVRDFNVEFERLVLRLREVHCELPPLVKGWLYLDKLRLGEHEELALLSSVNNQFDCRRLQQAAPWSHSAATRAGCIRRCQLNTSNGPSGRSRTIPMHTRIWCALPRGEARRWSVGMRPPGMQRRRTSAAIPKRWRWCLRPQWRRRNGPPALQRDLGPRCTPRARAPGKSRRNNNTSRWTRTSPRSGWRTTRSASGLWRTRSQH